MFKRAFYPLALAALVLPAVAAAKVYDVSGARLGLLGRGDVKAELTASAGAKPVRIAQVGGTLTITPLSDDVKIQCKSRDTSGDTSTSCSGKAVMAMVTGSHFSIQAAGKRYALGIPAGYTGTVDAANAVQCGKASGGVDCRALLQEMHKGRNGGATGSKGSGDGNSGGNANDTGAEPGTDASLAELAAALAALGK